jgi:hypothetical protein
MRKCILHVGMHKTGSTSIQESLGKFVSEKQSLRLAGLKGFNLSIPMIMMFSSTPAKNRNIRKRDLDIDKIERINLKNDKLMRSMFAEDNSTDYIISGEGICNIEKDGLVKLRKYLESFFSEIDVMAYVRTPKSFIESSLQQVIKGGSSNFNIHGKYPKYRSRFEKFYEVFGSEHVKLWKFDPGKFVDGCVVKDFCTKIGLDYSGIKVVRSNKSLSKEALAFIFSFRKSYAHGIGRDAINSNARLIRRLSRLKNNKFRLSPDLIEPIIMNNKRDVEWIERKTGISLDEDYEESDTDVKNEKNLLGYAVRSIDSLIDVIKDEIGENKSYGGIAGKYKDLIFGGAQAEVNTQTVGDLVHLLKEVLDKKYIDKLDITGTEGTMKLVEMLAKIDEVDPELFKNPAFKKNATPLLRHAFNIINKEIESVGEGNVHFPGLGKFRVKTVERKNKDGEMVQRKVVHFIAIKNKDKGLKPDTIAGAAVSPTE